MVIIVFTDETIMLHGQKIIVLYDPPHLLKGIRNNFLEKDIEINVHEKGLNVKAVASWNIIETAYKMDIYSNLLNRQLKKLTDQHILKNKIKKMKVKLAAQVFSATLSAFVEYNSQIQSKSKLLIVIHIIIIKLAFLITKIVIKNN